MFTHTHTHTQKETENTRKRDLYLFGCIIKLFTNILAKITRAGNLIPLKSALYIHFVLESKIVRLYFPLDKLSHA